MKAPALPSHEFHGLRPAGADTRNAALPATGAGATPIVNAMTIDVEDYFQVSAFAAHVDRGAWDTMECRVERNVDRILGLLADAGASATFFTLGWIAERYPRLVRRIAAEGHEIASHGSAHLRASEHAPARLASQPCMSDIRRSPLRALRDWSNRDALQSDSPARACPGRKTGSQFCRTCANEDA